MQGNIPVLFGFYAIIPLLELAIKIGASIFLIYFLLNVIKFMKVKIKLEEQRIEQTTWFLKLYKSANEKLESDSAEAKV